MAKTKSIIRELGNSEATSKIRFSASLTRPVAKGVSRHGESATWTFLVLPKEASSKLPSRSMVSVEGTLNGTVFRGTLEPDGKGGHWLKVDRKLREAAGAEAGGVVTLEIAPVAPDREPEPRVPVDLRKALAAAPKKAREVWSDITPVARRDWIQWMTSGKRAETRVLRIEKACDMLAKGKRRPCCFDRSGMFDKSLSCPMADDADDESRGTRR
ncbi:MAG: YdeI/OmpD-associated family protein [Planctomycetota bacterium]